MWKGSRFKLCNEEEVCVCRTRCQNEAGQVSKHTENMCGLDHVLHYRTSFNKTNNNYYLIFNINAIKFEISNKVIFKAEG